MKAIKTVETALLFLVKFCYLCSRGRNRTVCIYTFTYFTHKRVSHQLEQVATLSQDTKKKTTLIRKEATERNEAKNPIKSEDDDIPTVDQGKVAFKQGLPEIRESKSDVSDDKDTQTDEGYGSEEGLETPPDDHPNAREVDWTAHTKLRMMTHNRLTPRQEESDIDSAFNSDSEPDGEYITGEGSATSAIDSDDVMGLYSEEETHPKEIIAARAKTRKKHLHGPNFNRMLRDVPPLENYPTHFLIEKKIHEDDVYNFILQHEKERLAPAALDFTVGAIPFEICGECKWNFHTGFCVECWMGLCENCAFPHRCRHELRKTF